MSQWEIILAAAVGATLALGWLALLTPARVRAAFEAGRGARSWWSLYLGWGPVGFAGESTEHFNRMRLTLYMLGRRVHSRKVRMTPARAPWKKDEEGEGAREILDDILEGYRDFDERVGALESLRFFVRERRRILIDELAGRVRYGFEEYEKTGELSGYLWALRGVLGPAFNLHHEPDWSGHPVLAGAGRISLRVWPALLALDVALFFFSRPGASGARRALRSAEPAHA